MLALWYLNFAAGFCWAAMLMALPDGRSFPEPKRMTLPKAHRQSA